MGIGLERPLDLERGIAAMRQHELERTFATRLRICRRRSGDRFEQTKSQGFVHEPLHSAVGWMFWFMRNRLSGS